MLEKILQVFKIADLRKKVFFVLAILVLFRLMASIPIPDADLERIRSLFDANQMLGLLNIFTGGAMENVSVVMLGVGPYITATIIMQLLTLIYPRLKEMYYEEGEAGRMKFNQYSRYLTVPLAVLQSFAFLNLLKSQGVLGDLGFLNTIKDVALISAGSIFLMWLGELITEKKIGNGVSLLIFAGIVSGWPSAFRNSLLSYSPSQLPIYLGFLIVAVIVVAGVVLINEAERKVPVSYAKRVRGNKMYGGVTSYLPLKINQAGVIPIIFALSILMFPQFIGQVLAVVKTGWAAALSKFFIDALQNNWLYGALYFIFVVFFTYFYTAVTFDPKEISKNLQKSGGFIPGVRPGFFTAEFLKKILYRTTLVGAIFLGIIAVLPIVAQGFTGVQTMTIGGTSVLIVVSVVLETLRQIKSQLVMREYD